MHLSYLLFEQSSDIDQGIRKIYSSLNRKVKEAQKQRPEVQSDNEDNPYFKEDEVANFLNYRKPLPDNKERGNLEHVLNQLENKEKDT